MEFEVEVVFAGEGNQSPKEGHTYDEIILIVEGVISLERDDQDEVTTHSKLDTIFLPKGTVHQITVVQAPVKRPRPRPRPSLLYQQFSQDQDYDQD
jgi:quercetin dioxygenase-like cupin family protein